MTEQTEPSEGEAAENSQVGETQESQPASQQVGDLLGGALFVALGIFAIIAAVGMPRRGNLGFFTSPGFVPLLLGTLIACLCSVLVFRALRRGALGGIGEWFRIIKESEESRRVIVLVILLIIYAALIGTLNFVAVTLVFSLVTLFYVQAGKPWQVLVYSVLITTLAGVLIPTLFNMPLP